MPPRVAWKRRTPLLSAVSALARARPDWSPSRTDSGAGLVRETASWSSSRTLSGVAAPSASSRQISSTPSAARAAQASSAAAGSPEKKPAMRADTASPALARGLDDGARGLGGGGVCGHGDLDHPDAQGGGGLDVLGGGDERRGGARAGVAVGAQRGQLALAGRAGGEVEDAHGHARVTQRRDELGHPARVGALGPQRGGDPGVDHRGVGRQQVGELAPGAGVEQQRGGEPRGVGGQHLADEDRVVAALVGVDDPAVQPAEGVAEDGGPGLGGGRLQPGEAVGELRAAGRRSACRSRPGPWPGC